MPCTLNFKEIIYINYLNSLGSIVLNMFLNEDITKHNFSLLSLNSSPSWRPLFNNDFSCLTSEYPDDFQLELSERCINVFKEIAKSMF